MILITNSSNLGQIDSSCRSIRLSATETDSAAESEIRRKVGTERFSEPLC